MWRPRIVGAAAGVAGIIVLAACGEPSGQVSPSGQTWTVTFDKGFENAAGTPIVTAMAVCHGDNYWTETNGWNVNDYGPTIALSVYCPTGVVAGSWGEYRS